MSTFTKSVIALVLAGVIGVAIYGAYQYPKALQSLSSATGSTFSTAKIAAIVISPTTSSATSSSLYNGDASTRYITDSFVACSTVGTSYTAYTGVGLASWLWRMATTSTNAPILLANTNYAANITVGTTTVDGNYTASTTEGVLTGYSRIWPSATYLTIQPNATNTATCVVGVHYLGS